MAKKIYKTYVGEVNRKWPWYECAAVSSDGKRIVTGSKVIIPLETLLQYKKDKSVKLISGVVAIWDAETGQLMGSPIEESCAVTSVAFSPNGKLLAVGGYGGILILDTETRQKTGTPLNLPLEVGNVDYLTFSPNGKRLASVQAEKGGILRSLDYAIRIWDMESRQQIGQPIKGHSERITSIAYSPDGKRLVSASNDKTVRIWDVETRECIKVLEGHTKKVMSAAYSPDGKKIVSASWDKTIRIWDAESGLQMGQLMENEKYPLAVWCAAFSPDGKRIVSGGSDCSINIWNAETLQRVCEPLPEYFSMPLWLVTFTPDGKRIIAASADAVIRMWDISELD